LQAAVKDPRIGRVILNEPPRSYWQGPAMLNALRVTDIAEFAGAVAPRSIVSLTTLPREFEMTKAIYGLERAAKQLRGAQSLSEALGLVSSDRPDKRAQ
jgi:hypothetical protein